MARSPSLALLALVAVICGAPAVAADPAATSQIARKGPVAAVRQRPHVAIDDFGRAEIRNALGSVLAQSSVGNGYMFQGRRLDPETGLLYFRARYYDPETGRFLQRDPVWDPTNLGNQHTFVGNNPTTGMDPTGLAGSQTETMLAGGGTAWDQLWAGHPLDAAWTAYKSGLDAATQSATIGGLPNPLGMARAAYGQVHALATGQWSISATDLIPGYHSLDNAARAWTSGEPGGRFAAVVYVADFFEEALGAYAGARFVPQVFRGAPVVDPVADTSFLVKAWRAGRRGSTYADDQAALTLLQNPSYRWVVTPTIYKEFLKVPTGSSSRMRFLRGLSNVEVLTTGAAALRQGSTFQAVFGQLRQIANRSSLGAGNRAVTGGVKSHFNDIVNTAFAKELGIPLVTADRSWINFLQNLGRPVGADARHFLHPGPP